MTRSGRQLASRVWRESAFAAQARALAVLARLAGGPKAGTALARVGSPARLLDTRVGDVPTCLAYPGRARGPRPALVFLNGTTPLGRFHPEVRRLACALARTGAAVYVPDLPGLARGAISAETVSAGVEVARTVTTFADVRGGRVGLAGISVGATLALLAAEDDTLAERVSVVAGVAPYTDLVTAIRLATTRSYLLDGRPVSYESTPFLGVVLARSIAASLPDGPDRSELLPVVDSIEDGSPDPLAAFRAGGVALRSPVARSLGELLGNRDPARFDELYGVLPPGLRERVARLSPIAGASRLRAPVELASAPLDKYFPVEESRALARAGAPARVTVTPALAHAGLELSLRGARGLADLDLWVVRALQALWRPG